MTPNERSTIEQRIERQLEIDARTDPPAPELLVAWLNASQRSDVGSDADREMAMARIVRAAERGGIAHMTAVADWISKLPPPLPDPKAPRTHEVPASRPTPGRGWFARLGDDDDAFPGYWQPTLQLDGLQVPSGIGFTTEEDCLDFIRTEILGKGMWKP